MKPYRALTILGGVLVVLFVAAVALPCFIRDKGAANEASAVGSLRTLNSVCYFYAEKHKKSFGSKLEDYSELIDQKLLSGQKSGYRFRYVAGSANKQGIVDTYQIFAEPITPDKTRNRYFFTDETGVIRYGIGSVNQQSPAL